MKTNFFDNFLKWFFIVSAIFSFTNFILSIMDNKPFFDFLISFLIQSVSSLYFIMKTNKEWIKENMFYLLSTMTGLLFTQTFVYFYHGVNFGVNFLISIFLLISTFYSFIDYRKNNLN